MSDYSSDTYLSNLSYINKDFNSIWSEMLELVPTLTNKWNPSEANESDPLVMLLKLLAIYADKINYNSDKHILERFPSTLTQQRSAYDVYDTLGYSPSWYKSATTNIYIYYNSKYDLVDSEDTNQYTSTVTLPRFTEVTDDDSETTFTLLENAYFTMGTKSTQSIYAIEGTLNDFTVNDSTCITAENLDSQNRLYFTQTNIAENGVFISNNSDFSDITADDLDLEPNTDTWVRVDNLSQYLPGYKVYKLGVDVSTSSVYLQFPDDIGELVGSGLYIKYIVSAGASGNIAKSTISQFVNDIELTNETSTSDATAEITSEYLTITNRYATTNGSDPLDIDEMYAEFKKIVGTFDTLVSLKDYENYIYSYTTTNTSKYVVSNVRVSDRTNDLYQSASYVTLKTDGSIFTETLYLTQESEDEETNLPIINAYSLRLYALAPVNSAVDTDTLYETSFTDCTETQIDNILDAIDVSKHVQHDFLDPGSPIIIKYGLSGQIYLSSKVSQAEAVAVQENVYAALYETFNSRNMEWGVAPVYGDIVDCIKDADSRIQYVGLNAPDYTVSSYDEYLKDFDTKNCGLDVLQRSILAGVTPWTDYVDFTYDYTQSNNKYYGAMGVSTITSSGSSGSTTTTTTQSAITSISSYVNVSDNTSSKILLVNENEDFTIIAPTYKTSLTYSNYLYYVAYGTQTIAADTPTLLKAENYIYLFETRDDAKSYLAERGSVTPTYTLGPDTIVKCSATIKKEEVVNMGSSITIDTLEKSIGDVEAPDGSYFYICSNVAQLSGSDNNPLYAVGGTYTLRTGEYVIYSDLAKTEAGILSEGTTLISPDGYITIAQITSSTMSEILSDGDINDDISMSKYANGAIQYMLNTMYTFGAGYEIKAVNPDNTDTTYSILKNYDNSDPHTPFNIEDNSGTGVVLIQYKLSTDSEWSSIDRLISSDSYQGLYRLAINLATVGEPQILSGVSDSSHYTTSQTINLTLADGSSATISGSASSNKGIQLTSILVTSGGQTIALTDTEQDVTFLMSYDVTTDVVDSNYFHEIDWSSSTITVPGQSGQLAIIPYITSSTDSTVYYLLIECGTKLSQTMGDITLYAIADPKVLNANATYYTGSGSDELVSNILNGASYAKLTTAELYQDGYCPTYEVNDNDLIEYPMQGQESYFNKNHICNRYVLAKWDMNTDNLKVSSQSISS